MVKTHIIEIPIANGAAIGFLNNNCFFPVHCSHARAPSYFAESVIKKVKAVTCVLKQKPFGTKYDVTVVPSKNGATVIFGQHVNQTKRGIYFLKTNSQQPYLTEDSI